MTACAEEPRCRLHQIGGDERRAGDLAPVCLDRLLAIPGAHEDTARAHGHTEADVNRLVANDEGFAQIDRMLRLGLPDEPWCRLSAVAERSIPFGPRRRMM